MPRVQKLIFALILALAASVMASPAGAAGPEPAIPVKGMVTLVDLGANACIPCKMMAPILEKLEKTYQGKAAVVFIDVWKNPAGADRFKIRVIPTQIFFDKNGKEVYRHEGFMSEKDIVAVLKKLGVN
jgi:thioredoxin 1